MRTTVKLNPQLLAEANEVAAASGRTLEAVVEDALRESLHRRSTRTSGPLTIPTFRGRGLQPGVDLNDSAALLELMESDRASRRRQRPDLRAPRRRG